MVTASATRTASQIEDTLENRDVRSLGAIALSAAGGVIVAQTVSDMVMETIGMPVDPTSITEYAATIGAKGAVALAFGAVAGSVGSGIALVATAFMGLGALASAGADVVELLLTTAPLGGSRPMAQVGAHQTASANSSTSTSTSASSSTRASASNGSGTAAGSF